MRLHLNGKIREIRADTIVALLSLLELNKDMVAIEINDEIVHRHHFETKKIKENDRIEIVTAVGGG